ncbi:alpha/beta hydrolase family protein [Kytococcus sp. Marseille-QA3725]
MALTSAVWRRIGAVAGWVVGSTAALTGAAAVGTAVYFGRRVLTPDAVHPDDCELLAIDSVHRTVTLAANGLTLQPGRYGLWLKGGDRHLRFGEVLEHQQEAGRVVRRLDAVDGPFPVPGPARLNPYYYPRDPRLALGMPARDLRLASDIGEFPCWQILPEGVAEGPDLTHDRWMITVHGRAARREEGFRAVRPFRESGYACLVPAYRNDSEAPRSADGRYTLGLTEWRDIEAAIEYAVEHGAREVVLVGYSMGGAIVLQTLVQSELAHLVSCVVLDAPVVDWGQVLSHAASRAKVPAGVEQLARHLMGREEAKFLFAISEPRDLALMNWLDRAAELTHQMLVIHSVVDEVVPVHSSRELAAMRPDLVTLQEWPVGMHCREWNTDPARWEQVVARYLARTRVSTGS